MSRYVSQSISNKDHNGNKNPLLFFSVILGVDVLWHGSLYSSCVVSFMFYHVDCSVLNAMFLCIDIASKNYISIYLIITIVYMSRKNN